MSHLFDTAVTLHIGWCSDGVEALWYKNSCQVHRELVTPDGRLYLWFGPHETSSGTAREMEFLPGNWTWDMVQVLNERKVTKQLQKRTAAIALNPRAERFERRYEFAFADPRCIQQILSYMNPVACCE